MSESPATVLLLKSVDANGKAYNDFQWPLTVGAEVVAPDWNAGKHCGNGLHGFLWGVGESALASWAPDAKWLVLEALASEVVNLGGKVKVPRCKVIYVGDVKGAAALIQTRAPAGLPVIAGTATAGDAGTATAGDAGTATAGTRGTATAGYAGTATAGYAGTATAGYAGKAKAGLDGVLVILWYDETQCKYRKAVAVVGENGIEPDIAYRVDTLGKFVRAEQ